MGEVKRRGQTWWIRYYKNGRRYEESSGSTKEADAKSLLRLREGDIERGVAMTPKVGRIWFEEAATDVLNDYRTNRKRSLDDVERRIDLHLKPFFGNRRMASITTADIREYIDSRQKETTVLKRRSLSLRATARLDMCRNNGEPSLGSRTPRSIANSPHSSGCSTSPSKRGS